MITTCLKKNFDYVKSLGAVIVFDYMDIEVIARVTMEFDKGECAGIFMAAGLKDGNTTACEIASMCKQNVRSHLAPPFLFTKLTQSLLA